MKSYALRKKVTQKVTFLRRNSFSVDSRINFWNFFFHSVDYKMRFCFTTYSKKTSNTDSFYGAILALFQEIKFYPAEQCLSVAFIIISSCCYTLRLRLKKCHVLLKLNVSCWFIITLMMFYKNIISNFKVINKQYLSAIWVVEGI